MIDKTEGDWSDRGIKPTTDRTKSTIEIINFIEGLTKELDMWRRGAVLQNNKIEKLTKQNEQLKELLNECAEWLTYIDRDCGLIAKMDKLLKEQTDD